MNHRSKKKPFKKNTANDPLFLTSWSALEEYLKFKPQDIIRIECSEREFDKLSQMIKKYSCEIELKSHCEEFKAFISTHIGSELELELSLQSEKQKQVLLALDHITDTRNFGAIIRSAAFFGVNRIIIPKQRQAAVTSGTIATCQGALALVSLYEVTNLARALRNVKQYGFWILGADMDGEPIESYSQKFDKSVLVMGSEDKGLSRNIQETCDVQVAIQGSASLESLNVSVAAGIMLNCLGKSL